MSDSFDTATLNRMLDIAQHAAVRMRHFSVSQVERIVRAVAQAGLDRAEFYAEWAVRELGYGRVESKILKNVSRQSPWLTWTCVPAA